MSVAAGSLLAMTTPFRPVIRSQADLETAWRHLMQPLGFDSPSLWLMVVCDDDRPLPQLTELARTNPLPTEQDRDALAHLMPLVARSIPGVRLAFLRSRPGAGSPDDSDRAWAELLYDVAREAGVACEVVHVATDETVAPVPMDSVDLRSA